MIKIIMILVSLGLFAAGAYVAHRLLRGSEKGNYFKKTFVYIYSAMAIWSFVYFFVCVIYAGIRLSWVWLWLLICLFCVIRVIMLRAEVKGKPLVRIPAAVRAVYRGLFVAGLVFFLVVESWIVDAMTADPPRDLEYVVVLGAGLRGKDPSNTLRMRIKRAAEYMEENPDTMIIASGGQGPDELISEAECIRDQLVNNYGCDPERIILEDRSRDTEENLYNSLVIIGKADVPVGIITNSFHEYRAMRIAEHSGYANVHSVPATTLLPVGIHYLVREFFGVVELMIKY